MAGSQAGLNNLVAKGVGSRDGKPTFGRRRGKKEPLAGDSLMAHALDGGAAPDDAASEATARLLMRAMIAAASTGWHPRRRRAGAHHGRRP